MKKDVNLIKALQQISDDRNISEETIIEALKEALTKAYRNHIDIQDVEVRVDIDEKSGAIEVFHRRLIVENVEDDELEISLEDARKLNENYEIGQFVDEPVDYHEFGRKAVVLAKNVMKQKTREAQKQAVYDEYCDKLEEMVSGVVETVEDKFCLVNIGKTIGLMPKVAQIPGEVYHEGQTIKVVISDVNKETKGAQVLVSRADAAFVKRLFEKEVPEIYQGIIEIKAIAREAGERTKIAVYSKNENIDPIGACIGPKGSRVQGIIDEIRGEKIDIFQWSDDVTELIKNALAPAEIRAVIPNPEKRGLMVIVDEDQLSLAIGKKGKNARLAVKLTGQTIDIKSVEDAETMGIDWQAIAKAEIERVQAEKAEERAIRQQELFKELQTREEEAEFSDELLGDDEIIEEFIPEHEKTVEVTAETVEPEKTAEEVAAEKAKKAAKKAVEDAAREAAEKEALELEAAAREAKQRKKQKSIEAEIEEKRSYVSKFENIAGAKKEDSKPVSKKRRKNNNDDVELGSDEGYISKPTHNPNQQASSLKPIYTEEELAEIEAQQAEEEEKDWINEDIDFDEYDEYYDDEN